MKKLIAQWLFGRTDARQLHIIGCSRSGTTMLHAAMSAFESALLNPSETRPGIPGVRRSLRMGGQFREIGAKRGEPRFFITKRQYNWFQPQEVDWLVQRVLAADIGLIHIVRDPRDVLMSQHANSSRERYVTPEHWRESIAAADQVERAVERRVKWLTLRYEDVIQKPEETQSAIAQTFGLTLRPGARIDRVKDNLERSGLTLKPYMKAAMQGVRNADPTSIGKWRRAATNPEEQLLADPATASLYRAFMKRHGYGDDGLAAVPDAAAQKAI